MTKKSKFFAELKKESNIKKFGLKAKKIELGLNDDLGDAVNKAYESFKELNDEISFTDGLISMFDSATRDLAAQQSTLRYVGDDLNKTIGDLNALIRNAEVVANDLGIQPEDLPNYNIAQEALETFSAVEKADEIDTEIMKRIN